MALVPEPIFPTLSLEPGPMRALRRSATDIPFWYLVVSWLTVGADLFLFDGSSCSVVKVDGFGFEVFPDFGPAIGTPEFLRGSKLNCVLCLLDLEVIILI